MSEGDMSDNEPVTSETVAGPATDQTAPSPAKRGRGRPKGSKTRHDRATAKAAHNACGPTMHDMMTAAARFHFAEATRAQEVFNAPQGTPGISAADRVKARKDLEHHLGKAANYAKPALPYELAKLGPQKLPLKDDCYFDLSKLSDGDLGTLEKLIVACHIRAATVD